MANFACVGCTRCSLLACQQCFDKFIAAKTRESEKRMLIEFQAQIIMVFGPDNFASTILSLGLIHLINNSALNFERVRRQVLALQEIYEIGLKKPSDPKVIEPANFTLSRLPTTEELWEHFVERDGPMFFRDEELPIMWGEIDSDENLYYTAEIFRIPGKPSEDLLYLHYRDVGALTDITLRPHCGGDYSLSEHALNRFMVSEFGAI